MDRNRISYLYLEPDSGRGADPEPVVVVVGRGAVADSPNLFRSPMWGLPKRQFQHDSVLGQLSANFGIIIVCFIYIHTCIVTQIGLALVWKRALLP